MLGEGDTDVSAGGADVFSELPQPARRPASKAAERTAPMNFLFAMKLILSEAPARGANKARRFILLVTNAYSPLYSFFAGLQE